MIRKITLEVCAGRIDDALVAINAGADRIEFCCALELDGLTPSIGSVIQLRSQTTKPIVALVRSRSGDFVFDKHEIAAMIDDSKRLLDSGATSIATGFLNPDHSISLPAMRDLAREIGAQNITFHRAFDLTPDYTVAMTSLIDLGIKRILTSGGGQTAAQSIESLRALIEVADNKIEILPAGGISPTNAALIIRQTGVRQIHGSFRKQGRAAVDASNTNPQPDLRVDAELVRETREILNELELEISGRTVGQDRI